MNTKVTDPSFQFKALNHEDDSTVRHLLETYPEPGLVSTQMQMHTELVGKAFDLIRPGSYSLGAFSSQDKSSLAGIIYGWPHKIQIQGKQYHGVLIYGLVVQPQYRNSELEGLLRNKLLDWASQNFEKGSLLIYAYTQKPGSDELPKVTGRQLALTPIKTLPQVISNSN